ncbi:hypothetical protein ACHAXR_013135 [Thalassiosira sp. AJA248-18]
MTFPSKAFLLAAALAAAYAPSSSGEETTTFVVDPKNGESSTTTTLHSSIDDGDLNLILKKHSPIEFLQLTPPNLVLSTTFPTPELHSAFSQWTTQYARTYKTLHEHALRKLIWLQNHSHIESHNNAKFTSGSASSSRHSLAHNDFSDLTNDEFQKRFYLGRYSPGVAKPKGRSDGSSWLTSTSRKLLRGDDSLETGEEKGEKGITDTEDDAAKTVVDVPDYKNWNEDGGVTKVKNQWFCGACWAFSAVGAIEGARYIKTGNLTELSIQQLIDCDMTDLGCGGGLMDQAFQYDEDSVGLCSLEEYPYAMHRHWLYGCRRYMPYCEPLPDSKVQEFVDVDKTEEALKAAVATQPVSVAVSAGPMDWQFYSSGIFDKGCEADIDHGVLAVGYGHYDPTADPDASSDSVAGDYWLIKNSWGESWGQNGYIQLGRGGGNEAEGGSSCVLTMASRPVLKEEGN